MRIFYAMEGAGGGAAVDGGGTGGGTPAPTGFDASDAKFDAMTDETFASTLADGQVPHDESNAGTPDPAAAAAAATPAAPQKIPLKLSNGTTAEATPEEMAAAWERDQARGKHWQQTAVEQVKQAERAADEKYRGLYGQKIDALQGQIATLLERMDGANPQGRQADPAATREQGGGEDKTVVDILRSQIAKDMETAIARHLAPLHEGQWENATESLENATAAYDGDRDELRDDLRQYGVVFNEKGQIDPSKNSPAKVQRAAQMAVKQREIDHQTAAQYAEWRDGALKEYPEGTFDNDDRATLAGLVLQAAKGDKKNGIPKRTPDALMWKDFARQVYDKNVTRAQKLSAALNKQRATAAGKKADLKTVPKPGEEPARREQGKPVNPWDEAENKADTLFQT